MGSRFTAEHARRAVEKACVPYTLEEVCGRIKRMAEAGRLWTEFEANRWDDKLTAMLSEDGYGVKFIRMDTAVLVTWGRKPRRLRGAAVVALGIRIIV